MNHLLAWILTITAFAGVFYPIIRYVGNKYYYNINTTPIRYWLNKKQKAKKRYKTFNKRNKKYIVVNKVNNYSFNKYSNSRLTKVNK